MIAPLAALLLAVGGAAADPTRGVAVRSLQPQAPLYQRRVAVIVGIDRYEDDGLRLDYAVHDARGMAAVLEDRFGFDEVHTLYDQQATLPAVRAKLAELQDLGPEDGLVLFWAGHGQSLPDGEGGLEGYLVPWGGSLKPGLAYENLPMAELRGRLLEDIPAKHKLVIVDACYAGILALRGGDVLPPELAGVDELTRRPAVQVLTAGRADEAVLDGGPGGHSVFTGRLIASLEAVDDYITAGELAASVQRGVRDEARARGHQQNPDFERVMGDGDFVLVPRGDLSARAPTRAAGPTAPALWGFTVPGLAHPESGQRRLWLARTRVLARPLATREVRVGGTTGVDSAEGPNEELASEVGLTAAVAGWRVDLDAGGSFDLLARGGSSAAGTLAVTTPRWGRDGFSVALRPEVGVSALRHQAIVGGAVLVGGDVARLRWTASGGASGLGPASQVGLRWGGAGMGVGVLGHGRAWWRSGVPRVAELGGRMYLDTARPRGVRLQLGAGPTVTALRLDEGLSAWLQEPDALVAFDGTARGAGLVGEARAGEGWHLLSAPGFDLDLALTVPLGRPGQ